MCEWLNSKADSVVFIVQWMNEHGYQSTVLTTSDWNLVEEKIAQLKQCSECQKIKVTRQASELWFGAHRPGPEWK